MTDIDKKREEIQIGLRKFISDKGWRGLNFIEAEEVLTSYLHSQGVVIKVDRELPKKICNTCKFMTGQEFLDSGYVAVKPLIKEVANE